MKNRILFLMEIIFLMFELNAMQKDNSKNKAFLERVKKEHEEWKKRTNKGITPINDTFEVEQIKKILEHNQNNAH